MIIAHCFIPVCLLTGFNKASRHQLLKIDDFDVDGAAYVAGQNREEVRGLLL